jgi:hypothetical protein
MLTAEVTIKGDVPNVARDIELAMEQTVYPYFRNWTNELLDAALAGPAKGSPYTVTVDGVAVPGREYIASARRQVDVRFIQGTVEVAVRILKEELEAAIKVASGTRPWLKRDQIAASVMLFYNGNPISSSTEIKDFLPGDYVMAVPSHINQAYANASKYGAKGYMGRAARRLRTKLRITKGGSALSLTAGRSKAAWHAITESGRHMTPPGVDPVTGKDRGFWGAWALTLRLRTNAVFRG